MAFMFDEKRIRANTIRHTDRSGALRFLLGGIGTGNVSLDSRGRLCDFEWFNAPAKGFLVPYTFFAIWSQIGSAQPDARVLEAAAPGPYTVMDYAAGGMPCLPRFESSEFESNYPFANIKFLRGGSQLDISLEAFTPFIPLDADDSGIPGAVLRYRVHNKSQSPATVSIAGSLSNVCGLDYFDGIEKLFLNGKAANEEFRADGLAGISMRAEGVAERDFSYGTMSIAASGIDGVTIKPTWLDGGWWDGAEEFWQDFRTDGDISPAKEHGGVGSVVTATVGRAVGSVAVKKRIGPDETAEFEFFLTWHFPNRWHAWWPDGHRLHEDYTPASTIKNYYATRFADAVAAARYLHGNLPRLERDSRNFSNALYSSTIDRDILDALASTLTVIRSTTCFRVEDGTFYAWEGCFNTAGSCAGNCTHVWNYAQSLAFLFPDLERSMRLTEFLVETDSDGLMAFRAKRKLDGQAWDMLPAADGQLGCVLRVFREWRLSGDDDFLRSVWKKLVPALNYAFNAWDKNGDFVLDGCQHNTYDIEFHGVTSMTNCIFFAALKAAAVMAAHLGEKELAAYWEKAGREGAEKMDAMLWNGEYYIQNISNEDLEKYRYQFGAGCLSDQLFGQQLAHVYGLGHILPPEHVKRAAYSIYRYNFARDLSEHHSVQRGYAFQGESGLVLCTWPKGGRPSQPFVYSDEVWTGIEYTVASLLIYEGYIEEAVEIVRAVRKRYDGVKRSPFNEIECGNHYSRSLASWSMLTALSGYRFDLPNKRISFAPKVSQNDFSCFFSTGSAWGVYRQRRMKDGTMKAEAIPLYGRMDGVIAETESK